MDLTSRFINAENRYKQVGRALCELIHSLEASDEEIERDLAQALRSAPERVKFLNLPPASGVGIEAFHHPVATFDARNWNKGAQAADLILAFADARRNYERAYVALPVSDRPRMKKPGDFIDAVS